MRRMRARGALVPTLMAVAFQACTAEAPDAAGTEEAGTPAGATAEEAARQDTTPIRAALPGLFEVMSGLERDMAQLSRGLWLENFDTIRAAAQAVADHPTLPPAEVEQVAAVLGSEMPGFKGMDTRVHDLAVEVTQAADREALAEVMATEAELRAGCVACHTAYRERLRAEIR